MQLNWRECVGCLTLLCVAVVMNGVLCADDENEDVQVQGLVLGDEAISQYWIGVRAEPVTEALKLHLDLEHGVLVQSVVSNSPAAVAGVAENDILLSYGDQKLTSIKDLIRAVRDCEDKATSVTVIHRGKRRTVEVKPDKRPAEFTARVVGADGQELTELLLNAGDGILEINNLPHRIFTLGPGLLEDNEVLQSATDEPLNLKITVEKESGKKARIKVKRDDMEWEVSEDDLMDLPTDIKPHIEKLLGRQRGGAAAKYIGSLLRLKDENGEGNGEETVIIPNADAIRSALRDRASRARPHIERILKDVEKTRNEVGRDALEELRKELAEIRKELRELRQDREEE